MTEPTISAPRPDVRAGDRWRFAVHNRLRGEGADARSEETRTVLRVTRDRIECEVESTDPAFARGRFVFTPHWNLVSRPALASPGDPPDEAGRWEWQPPYPQFRFPLAPGKTWAGTARVTNRATDTTNVHRYRVRVLGAERVTVPAGRFDTLPVRYEAEVTTAGSEDAAPGNTALAWRSAETLFYAPAAQLFVRAEFSVTGPDGARSRDAAHELLIYAPAPR